MNDSLFAAREELERKKLIGENSTCPCCAQFVRVYPRRITSRMVRDLYNIYRLGAVKSLQLNAAGGDHAKLRYWGLVTQGEDMLWRITQKGIAFLFERTKVPEVCFVFDGVVQGFGEKMCGVRDRVGKKFDYDTLMANVPNLSDRAAEINFS
jgi:hypothetical protein